MNSLLYLVVASCLFSMTSFAQLFQGPANGSVAAGAVVSTQTMKNVSAHMMGTGSQPLRNLGRIEFVPDEQNGMPVVGPAEGTNYYRDPGVSRGTTGGSPNLLFSFGGIPETNSIPPDPHCAVGPSHFMAVVNTSFRIYDKLANVTTTITANSWYNSVFANSGAFDPKILYDHFDQRWIMVWLQQNDNDHTGHILLSVSDDSDPNGNWYNWALPSKLNGTVNADNWSDYQGVGFDEDAIYITTNQFNFSSQFNYAKLRIIGKDQLYANTAGPVTWTDLWDIREPLSTGTRIFTLRPALMYGTPGSYFLVCRSPFSDPEAFVDVYTVSNPLTTPDLTGNRVVVTSYSTPPLANQLGGSTILIESGGSHFRFEPTFRNGHLYATHAVATAGGLYGGINFLKINTSTMIAEEDATFGEDGFWYFYPAIAVDQDENMVFTYSRSGETEYAGAYYTARWATDPPGTITGSHALQVGLGNYVKDFGSGRNRWGDYSGAWLDPTDQYSVWIFSEYAEAPYNRWGTAAGVIRLAPFTDPHITTAYRSLDYGNVEVGFAGDTLQFRFYNFGSPTLQITNISMNGTHFELVPAPAYPISIAYQDSAVIGVAFVPQARGDFVDTLKLTTNDPTQPDFSVIVRGHGYVINPAASGVLYGAGTAGSGTLYAINAATGAASTIGATGFTEIRSLLIRPSNGELMGLMASGSSASLLRINAMDADAYFLFDISVSNIRGATFDLNDDLYIAQTTGALFRVNVASRDTDYVGATGISSLYGLAVNPLTGQLWAVSLSGSLYRIDKTTGQSSLVGASGVSSFRDIEFDGNGDLYGVAGSSSSLIRLDTTNGHGSVVGATGVSGLNTLAVTGNLTGATVAGSKRPSKYRLDLPFPNPFNPTTEVKFAIPDHVHVVMRVFNVLGQEVKTLVDDQMEPGNFQVLWDGRNNQGILVSSGIYLFRLEAGPFRESRKVIFLK